MDPIDAWNDTSIDLVHCAKVKKALHDLHGL